VQVAHFELVGIHRICGRVHTEEVLGVKNLNFLLFVDPDDFRIWLEPSFVELSHHYYLIAINGVWQLDFESDEVVQQRGRLVVKGAGIPLHSLEVKRELLAVFWLLHFQGHETPLVILCDYVVVLVVGWVSLEHNVVLEYHQVASWSVQLGKPCYFFIGYLGLNQSECPKERANNFHHCGQYITIF